MGFFDNLLNRVKGWLAIRSDDGSKRKKCDMCDNLTEEELIPGPCGKNHHFCRSCVTLLFLTTVNNYNALLPNCCFEMFSYELADVLLTDNDTETLVLFDLKQLEDHLHRAKLQYRPLDGIDSDKQVCPRCGIRTDVPCHAFSHLGRSDGRRLSKAAKPCPHCNQVIDLSKGWYHRTCICGHCYETGSRETASQQTDPRNTAPFKISFHKFDQRS